MADTIKRTTLAVRDAEKAATWYEQVFGMARWFDKPFTLSGKGIALGKKGDQIQLIILKANDPVVGMIGLMEWVEPKMQTPPVPTTLEFGAPVFVVSTEDCRGVFERAKALGSQIYSEPREWTVVGANNETKHMIGTSLFDLDGYFYEINQTVSVENPN